MKIPVFTGFSPVSASCVKREFGAIECNHCVTNQGQTSVSWASDIHCTDCAVFTGSFCSALECQRHLTSVSLTPKNHLDAMSKILRSFDVSKNMSNDMSDDVIIASPASVTVKVTFQCFFMSIFTEISPSTGEVNFGPQFKCMHFDINSCTLFTWNFTFSLLLSLSLFS